MEAQKLGELLAMLRVLVDAELDVLAEGAVELFELLLVLCNLIEEFQRLLDNVLTDHLHDLVLLERLTGEVEREVFRVDNTLDEAEPFWDEISGIIGDEDASDVELDVVLGSLRLEEIERSALWNEEDGAEFKLTLDGEVLDGKMIFPVIGQRFVEGRILFLSNVLWVARPYRLGLVELLLLNL